MAAVVTISRKLTDQKIQCGPSRRNGIARWWNGSFSWWNGKLRWWNASQTQVAERRSTVHPVPAEFNHWIWVVVEQVVWSMMLCGTEDTGCHGKTQQCPLMRRRRTKCLWCQWRRHSSSLIASNLDDYTSIHPVWCNVLSMSVCPSVCHKNFKLLLLLLFLDGLEPFFGRQFIMTPSTKRCSSIFDLGP